jgi:hypothetical protein
MIARKYSQISQGKGRLPLQSGDGVGFGYDRIRQQFVVGAARVLNYDSQRRSVNKLFASGITHEHHSSIAHRGELETPGRQESNEGHLVKCQMVGDARSPTSTEWQIGRLGRGRAASHHEAFGEKAIRFWEIATVSVKQMRTYPHRGIRRELKPIEFENALHLSIQDRGRWMKTHALL